MPRAPTTVRASRPAPGWRGGAAAIAMLTFAVDAETPILAAGRRYADHAMAMTHQGYDARRGLPRLLSILAEFDLAATFFVPGFTADRYPHAVSAIVEAGHEVAHHSYSHRPATELSPVEEAVEFERGLEALDKLGIEPSGYRSPMWQATWHSAGLAAATGLGYDTSLMDDDRPYVIETDHGPVVELPPHWSLDDWEQYAYLPATAHRLRHRAAREGALALAGRTRRHARVRRPVPADEPLVPVRATGTGPQPAPPHRGDPRAR